MDSMEELVSQIQRLSSNMNSEEEISRFHSILKQAEESLLRPQASQLAPFLEQLNPSTHSLGYLYILEAYTGAALSKEQATVLVPVVATFLESCTAEQIRLVPDKFVSVCKKFKDEVVSLRTPMRGIAPIRTAIRKLQSSPEQLTTLHPDFLLLCLLAKCYKSGLSLLQEDIFEIDQPKDLFLYCYYGGMICIGQKSFRKAMELLKAVVTAPMSSTNAIAVEAHKKYILVSLIYNGQFSTGLPKYMSAMGQRNLKNYCQDNNLGLVKQVVSSLSKRNIQRLTQTYLTLSLEDMANRVQLNTSKEAELHVLQMIQDGEIFATINQKDGMVSFHEDPEQYKTCEMIEHIDSSIQRIMALSKKLSAVDENVSCDPTYLAKAGRERHRYDFDDYDSVPQRFNM
ncbi:hypothetical protein AQUCO_01100263v1 [Aquilegia coerulea]|uniref:COP9 signalosome complex subunit 3 n=1 Tax=Aquilegia coerulea TaxID=218851 RepID=A0A2G5E6F8_AQUCA|nr:hypothetical protein AQUCO_01100263v1 [Aquilegia coerulea]